MGIKEEITKIAVEQGYDGAKPKSIAQAIDALTDTLAGEDVKSGRSVVDAIRKYAPYVGSGGGTKRVELFNETVATVQDGDFLYAIVSGKKTDADKVYVTFDGTEYELPRVETSFGYVYGAMSGDNPDFSTYPLALSYNEDEGGWLVNTENAGTYQIAAYAEQQATPMPELGSMQQYMYRVDTVPVVGSALPNSGAKFKPSVLVGTTPIAERCECVAAGATVRDFVDDITGFYAVTEQININSSTYASVRQLDVERYMSPLGGIQFTMPALEDDEHLVIVESSGGGAE